jgi:glutathione peroxidase
MNVYEYVFESASGASMPLERWRGQPLLIVNTASKCGYTPQLAKLQKLYRDYRQSGLVVIAVPCNDFGEQEPGDDASIEAFAREEFGVEFPITRKVSINGFGVHPLYREIRDTWGEDAMPSWNFHKYLFDDHGQLVEHWPHSVEPDDPLLTHQVERHLNAWVL